MHRLARSLAPLALLAPLASAQDGGDVQALYYRAFYQETALRDFEGALATYQEIVDLAPEDVRGHVWYGECLAKLGRRAEAEAALKQAEALEPDNPSVRAALSRLARGGADQDELLTNVRATIERMVSGNRDQALRDLEAYGVRALPALAEGLRSPRAEVVDLCAHALTKLVQAGDPAAMQDLVEAFDDEEVLLRSTVVRYLAGHVPAESPIWAEVARIPERDSRSGAFIQYLEQGGPFSDQGPITATEEATLLRIVTDAREPGNEALWSCVLNTIVGRRGTERISDTARAAVTELVGASMTEPGLARRAIALHWQHPEYIAAMRPGLLPYLRSIPATESFNNEPVIDLLDDGRLPVEELREALDLPNADLRAAAWRGLSKHLGDGPYPDWLPEKLPGAVADWVQHRELRSGRPPTFDAYWGRYPFRQVDLPAVWASMLTSRRSQHAQLFAQSRRQVLQRFFRDAGDPSEAAASFCSSLAEEHRTTVLGELREMPSIPPIHAFAAQLAVEGDESTRYAAYWLLAAMVEQGDEAAAAGELPHLISDVMSDNYWPAALLLLARGNGDDVAALRRQVTAELGGEAPDTYGVDLAIPVLLLADGVEASRDLLVGRYSPERNVGRELLLAQRADTMSDVFDDLFHAHVGADPQAWAQLVRAAVGYPALLRQVYLDVELDDLPAEQAAEVIELGLGEAAIDDRFVLQKLLEAAGSRDMGVEAALLLPYVRHNRIEVRTAATQALDMLQRYDSYRRAVASFGGDARQRAVERIRTNVVSTNPDLRTAAAYAIAALGDPDGVALLLDLVEDDEASVRAAALKALETMGGAGTEDE